MKKLLLSYFFLGAVVFSAEAQKKKKNDWQVDEFDFTLSGSYGILPLRISGVMDVGNGFSTIRNGYHIATEPEYAIVDTTSYLMSGLIYGGVNVPFYRTSNWSTGVKLNAGIGYHKNIRAAEGLESMVFDFPQFLYYRNYKTKFDYSLLVGYKYTSAPLPYQLALGGVEFKLKRLADIRLSGSLNKYSYYRHFTDGRTEPAMQFREFTVTFINRF